MKTIMITLVAVTMFACTSNTVVTTCQDSTSCRDSLNLNDSIFMNRIKQMDSLHKEGKL